MREVTFAGAVAMALSSTPLLPANADSLRVIGSFEPGHSSTKALERLAAELAETTFDRLDLEIEADPALEPRAVVQAVQDGEAALGWTDLEALAALVPAYGAVTLPFLFDDQKEVFELLEGTVDHEEPFFALPAHSTPKVYLSSR